MFEVVVTCNLLIPNVTWPFLYQTNLKTQTTSDIVFKTVLWLIHILAKTLFGNDTEMFQLDKVSGL